MGQGQSFAEACKQHRMLTDEVAGERSEEHTSELQSRLHLVCRLLLEKKKNQAARKGNSRAAVRSLLIQVSFYSINQDPVNDKPDLHDLVQLETASDTTDTAVLSLSA